MKRGLGFVFGLILLISLGGVFSYSSIDECKNANDAYNAYNCYKEFTDSSDDSSICNEVDIDYLQDGCFSSFAIKLKNLGLCEEVSSDYRNSCYYDYAVDLRSIDVCSFVEEWYLRSAYSTMEMYSCEERINLENSLDSSKDPGLCEGLGGDFSCYMRVAKNANDPSICEKIEFLQPRASCFLDLAVQNQDEKICGRISDEFDASPCYSNLSILKKDVSICEYNFNDFYRASCVSNYALSLGDASSCEEYYCYSDLAKKQSDPSICLSILGLDSQSDSGLARYFGQCVSSASTKKEDVSYCDSLQKEIYSNQSLVDCYVGVAKNLNSAEICSLAPSKAIEESCISDFASSYNYAGGGSDNVESCLLIEGLEGQQECVFKVGQRNSDYSVCDFFDSDDLKNECLIYLADKLYDEKICDELGNLAEQSDWCSRKIEAKKEKMAEIFSFVKFILIILLIFLPFYLFFGFSYKSIAKRLYQNHPNSSWIPVVGPLNIARISSGKHWWPLLLLILYPIPFVFSETPFVFLIFPLASILFAVFVVIWHWGMYKALGRPGWWAILMGVPVLNFVLIGIAAWGNAPGSMSKK